MELFFDRQTGDAASRWLHRGAIALSAVTAALLAAAVKAPMSGAARVVALSLGPLSLTFFLVLAAVTGRSWQRPLPRLEDEPTAWLRLPAFAAALSVGFFALLFVGNLMPRAGLASGSVLVALHRLGSYLQVGAFAWLTYRIYTRQPFQLRIIALAGVLASLVSTQVLLGMLIARMRLPVVFESLHLMTGALCLGFSVLLTIDLFRASRRRAAPRLRLVRRDSGNVAGAGRVTA